MTNLVSSSGVVATDTSGVGTDSGDRGATNYGGDKAMFGFGVGTSGRHSQTNLVNSSGVVAGDVTGVGTARNGIRAAGYSITA
jgi:hypothetical protein